jgi:hypothetical protein
MTGMTHERFEALADAYGGDVARWPPGERDAAAVMTAEAPDLALDVLASASRLDAALDDWAAMAVRPALRAEIVAAAPRPRPRLRFPAWVLRLGLGAGLAGACASGLAAGVLLVAEPADTGSDAVTAAMSPFEGVGDDAGLVGDV